MPNTFSSAGDPQVILAWIDGFPLWAQISLGAGRLGFGRGVGAAAGAKPPCGDRLRTCRCLARCCQLWLSADHTRPPAELDTTSGKAMPVLIMLIVVFLLRNCLRRKEGPRVLFADPGVRAARHAALADQPGR
jgi:hypothetical protein